MPASLVVALQRGQERGRPGLDDGHGQSLNPRCFPVVLAEKPGCGAVREDVRRAGRGRRPAARSEGLLMATGSFGSAVGGAARQGLGATRRLAERALVTGAKRLWPAVRWAN
jgi:hypothetical protein